MMRACIATASLALCLCGIGLIVQGVTVPVTAETAQVELRKQFEQQLQANEAKLISMPTTFARQPIGAANAKPYDTAFPKNTPIARLSVDRLGVQEIILSGEPTHDRLARAPMMLKQGDAASPVTILAAHRDTHFLFIRDLEEGDTINLQSVTGEVSHYRVIRFETVRWDQFSYPLNPAQPLLALTTCYPFGGTEYGGPLRRVAWAQKIA